MEIKNLFGEGVEGLDYLELNREDDMSEGGETEAGCIERTTKLIPYRASEVVWGGGVRLKIIWC